MTQQTFPTDAAGRRISRLLRLRIAGRGGDASAAAGAGRGLWGAWCPPRAVENLGVSPSSQLHLTACPHPSDPTLPCNLCACRLLAALPKGLRLPFPPQIPLCSPAWLGFAFSLLPLVPPVLPLAGSGPIPHLSCPSPTSLMFISFRRPALVERLRFLNFLLFDEVRV